MSGGVDHTDARQELIRGYFQLRVSTLVAQGRERNVLHVSILLIVLSSVFSLIGVKLAGLVGVPIGIGLAYLVLIFITDNILGKIIK